MSTEYFVPSFPDSDVLGHELAGFEESPWARIRGISSFPAFLEAVQVEGWTANGVFGAKIMWNGLEKFLGNGVTQV